MAIDPDLLAGPICRQLFTGSPPPFPDSFGALGSSWMALTSVALLSSLFILALVYIFSQFLRNQQLIAWTKFELFQILGTAVIALFAILAMVEGMCTFDMTFLGEGGPGPNPYIVGGHKMNMYQISANYFASVEKVGGLLFVQMMWLVKVINFVSQVMWTSSPLGVGSSEKPLESMGQANNLLFLLVSGYVVSFLLLQLQIRMMEYLSLASLYYFFPFGVFFRAFEPTRAFGGTLIGLALAFNLFYPIIIVFNDYLMYNTVAQQKLELENALSMTNANIPTTQMNAARAGDQGGALDRTATGNFVSGITGSLYFILKPAMLYFIAAVVLPIINFILLVEVARGITRMFGEEVDVTNLTRLI